MTKVVYNGCYGGFSVSNEALQLYYQKKGITLYPGKTFCGETSYYTDPELTDFVSSREFERDDPVLIEVIEKLGDAANGICAKLVIEDVPKGTPYRITEYDGFESIETRDEVDWKVA